MIITGFYTDDDLYRSYWAVLKKYLHKYCLKYDFTRLDKNLSWQQTTQLKPSILLLQAIGRPLEDIVYLDVDCTIQRKPELFLKEGYDFDIGVHYIDWKKYSNRRKDKELGSGTIILPKNGKRLEILEKWVDKCKQFLNKWEQKCLQEVLDEGNYKIENIPAQYLTIFDSMKTVKDPVIIHSQASQQARKAERNGSHN